MELKDIKLINQGAHLAMYKASYMMNNNLEKEYEFVSRAGARDNGPDSKTIMDKTTFPDTQTRGVIIMALNPAQTQVLLMREFRPATGQNIFNHPMGLIDPGETIYQAAKRELYEETGLNILEILATLPPAFTAPGMSDQKTVTIIITATGDIQKSTNPAEITEPFWADREATLNLLLDKNNKFSAITQAMLFGWCAFNRMWL